jgi:O-methyltransferase
MNRNIKFKLQRLFNLRLTPLYSKYKSYTMITKEIYFSNLKICKDFGNINGEIVECGTWKGGMIAGIAEVLGPDRNYFLFDSYEGLPDATEKDGKSAFDYQQNKNSPGYYDNCTASQQSAIDAMRLSGAKNVKITKGWFNETLPKQQFKNGIAILRMDADWYDSTMDILTNLFPQMNKGGVIIIDDYYHWEGCTRAVHDYLSKQECTEAITSTSLGVCFIVKK